MKTECSACDGEVKGSPWKKSGFVGICQKCGGLIAIEVSHSAALNLVPPFFVKGETSPEDERYFDITYIEDGIGKIRRRHGWYDLKSGYMTQIG